MSRSMARSSTKVICYRQAREKTKSRGAPPLLPQGVTELKAIYELVEPAEFTVRRLVLMKKQEFVVVEDPKELLPGDWFQTFLGFTKIDP